jgi:hypothetical protein
LAGRTTLALPSGAGAPRSACSGVGFIGFMDATDMLISV